MPQFAVILPAAGTSSRFGADKLNQTLAGKSVIHRSIAAFFDRSDVELIVIAHSSESKLGSEFPARIVR